MSKDISIKSLAGFTLIELIIVIAILGILSAIAVPRVSGFREKAIQATCETNRRQLETYYAGYLELNGTEHDLFVFGTVREEAFGGIELCPLDGIIGWNEGKVTCSIHQDTTSGENEDEDDNGGEVPFL